MKIYLIDTSILIDFLRRKDKKETLLYRLVDKKYTLFISIITHTELYAGKSVWEQTQARHELDLLFSGLTIVPLDEDISKRAGKIRAVHGNNLLDTIIAATAIEKRISLVTLNVKDFERITELSLYRSLFEE